MTEQSKTRAGRGWPLALVLSAVGIAAFWINWFASGDYADKGTECYRLFENTFPLPDGVMAVVMLALAVLYRRNAAQAWKLGAWVAGMILFLGNLDTLYHLQHGTFEALPELDALLSLAISVYCYALFAALAWKFSRGLGLYTGCPRRGRVFSGIMVLYAAGTTGYWVFAGLPSDVPSLPCTEQFIAAFWLADFASVATALGAAVGIQLRKNWGLWLGYATISGLFFATLNFLALGILNADLLGGTQPVWVGASVGFLAIVAALTVLLYKMEAAGGNA